MRISFILPLFIWFSILVSSISAFAENKQELTPPREKELATYMGELQRITHKLSLAAQAKNSELTRFYLHESLEILEGMQEELPEYEDIPVAIFIERFALPAYEPLRKHFKKKSKKNKGKELTALAKPVIDSCNQCHAATKFGFIKITEAKSNPFNQDFKPQ